MKRYLLLLLLIALHANAQPKQWKSIGIGGGGAMFNPTFSPNNDSDMFITCDMGDLFHSVNSGATWNIVDFRQVASSSPTKVCYTNHPKILYTLDYGHGGAVVKSIDGGTLWNALSGWSGTAYYLFSDVNDSLRIIASDYNAIYFSKDGGKNFKKIFYFPACYVAGAFFDANNIYVATKSGILSSNDSGANFSINKISGIPVPDNMFSFAGAKQNGHTRFVCITADSNDAYPGVENFNFSTFRGIFKMELGDKKWSSFKMNLDTSSQFPLYCGMATNDTGTVYVAGSTTYGNPLVLKSTSSGNWVNIMTVGIYQYDGINQNVYTAWVGFRGDYPWYSSAAIGFSVAPKNSNKAAITGMGDAYYTYDGGKYWHQLYEDTADQNPPFQKTPKGKNYHSNGLEVTGCWCIQWMDSTNIFAGFTDIKGIRSSDAGESWNFNYTGHDLNTMYHMVQSAQNGYFYAGTSSVHDMYKSTHLMDNQCNPSYDDGKVLYTSDKGATWNTVYTFGHPVVKMATDPNNPKKLYASVIQHSATTSIGGIYVCNNIIDSSTVWNKLPDPPRTEGHPWDLHILNDGSILCTYSGRRTTKVFTASSGVFILKAGANAWTDVSDPNMKYYTKEIIIDNNDTTQSTWYVCVNNGWSGTGNDMGGIYRTKDRGKHWTRLTPSSEPDVWNMNFESATINPNNKDEMYMTTADHGLWHTTNLNDSMPTISLIESYHYCSPEHVYFHPYRKNEIWIGSYGNGLQRGIDNLTTGINIEEPVSKDKLKVFPNPSNTWVNISFDFALPTYATISIYNMQGTKIQVIATGKFNGKQTLVWNTTGLPEGIYLCELLSDGAKSVQRISVIR